MKLNSQISLKDGNCLNPVSAGTFFIRQNLRSVVLTHKDDTRAEIINPLTAKLFNLNFHPLEVVPR